jgi:hypothetical protein
VSGFVIIVQKLQVLLPQYYVGRSTVYTALPVCRYIICSRLQTCLGSVKISATSITRSTGIK